MGFSKLKTPPNSPSTCSCSKSREVGRAKSLGREIWTREKAYQASLKRYSSLVIRTLGALQVVWAVKHSHICDAFLDADAAAFLATKLGDKQGGGSSCCSPPAPESCSSSGQLPKPAIIGADGVHLPPSRSSKTPPPFPCDDGFVICIIHCYMRGYE